MKFSSSRYHSLYVSVPVTAVRSVKDTVISELSCTEPLFRKRGTKARIKMMTIIAAEQPNPPLLPGPGQPKPPPENTGPPHLLRGPPHPGPPGGGPPKPGPRPLPGLPPNPPPRPPNDLPPECPPPPCEPPPLPIVYFPFLPKNDIPIIKQSG